MTTSLTAIRNAKLPNMSGSFDIKITDGYISDIRNCTEGFKQDANAAHTIDAHHKLVLPGLIEMHTHIDKTYTNIESEEGTLMSAIQAMDRNKQARTLQDITTNAERAIRQATKHGVQRLRSHIDLGSNEDLEVISALLKVKQRYQNTIDLDFTVLGATETKADMALMEEAIKLGASMIGGAPALSNSPRQSVINAVELAGKLEVGLDLHIDEKESTDFLTLEYLADACIGIGFEHPVIASHCCSLAFLDENQLAQLTAKIKQADISIVSLPVCNLFLQGRHIHPRPRGMAPIKHLARSGVNVCVGSDNVHDPFNPYGDYDTLQALHIACITAQISTSHDIDSAIHFIGENAAKALQDQNYGLRVGATANLCITAAEDLRSCILSPPERLATIYRGKLVYQKTVEEVWH